MVPPPFYGAKTISQVIFYMTRYRIAVILVLLHRIELVIKPAFYPRLTRHACHLAEQRGVPQFLGYQHRSYLLARAGAAVNLIDPPPPQSQPVVIAEPVPEPEQHPRPVLLAECPALLSFLAGNVTSGSLPGDASGKTTLKPGSIRPGFNIRPRVGVEECPLTCGQDYFRWQRLRHRDPGASSEMLFLYISPELATRFAVAEGDTVPALNDPVVRIAKAVKLRVRGPSVIAL